MKVIIYFFLLIALFTASFDLIGALPIGGGNLRVTNLAMVGFIFSALPFLTSGLPKPVGFGWLLVWTLINTACVYNAPSIFRTYAFLIWLWVDVLFIFLTSAVFRNDWDVWNLGRINYVIYILISLLGLLQFVAFGAGVDIFVKQTWNSHFARINGFSYEPSYFSTYIMVGWAMSFYLALRGVHLFSSNLTWPVVILHTVALLLCSSRLGYMGMAVMAICMVPRVLLLARQSRVSGVLIAMAFAGGIVVVLAVATLLVFRKSSRPIAVLEGTGLGGTAAHSVDDRLADFQKYVSLLTANPLKGYSLGGIAPVIAGAGKGETIDYDEIRHAQGVNVSMEVLLATGVPGALLFFVYIYKLTIGALWRKFKQAGTELHILAMANVWGLIMQFFMLQFNQNILRNYFWIQIAVVSCLLTQLKRDGDAGAESGDSFS